MLAACAAAFADERADKEQELARIKAELKPLREKAYLEQDVVAAKEKLNNAYRFYWDTVRAAMIRLDPSKQSLVEQEIAARKALNPIGTAKKP
jgi:hypothetical protein